MVTGRGGLTALGEPRGLADASLKLGWEQDFLTRKEKRRDSST